MKKYEIEIKTSFINTIFAGIAISIILQVFFHLFGRWDYYYASGCRTYCILKSSHFISFEDYEASPGEVYELFSFYKLKNSFLLSFDSHWTSLGVTAIVSILVLNLIKVVDFKIINKNGSRKKLFNEDPKFYLSILLAFLIIGLFIYNTFYFNK